MRINAAAKIIIVRIQRKLQKIRGLRVKVKLGE